MTRRLAQSLDLSPPRAQRSRAATHQNRFTTEDTEEHGKTEKNAST